MALTATATSLLQKHVIEVLHMTNPIIIETSPEKKNLRFFICDFKSIKEHCTIHANVVIYALLYVLVFYIKLLLVFLQYYYIKKSFII